MRSRWPGDGRRGRRGDRDRARDREHDADQLAESGELVKAERGYRLPESRADGNALRSPGGSGANLVSSTTMASMTDGWHHSAGDRRRRRAAPPGRLRFGHPGGRTRDSRLGRTLVRNAQRQRHQPLHARRCRRNRHPRPAPDRRRHPPARRIRSCQLTRPCSQPNRHPDRRGLRAPSSCDRRRRQHATQPSCPAADRRTACACADGNPVVLRRRWVRDALADAAGVAGVGVLARAR
jgi:hypothetical protein